MALRTSGVRQPSIWASVVSDDALALRDWLLALGFTEDLMIPGERAAPFITAKWIGPTAVACCSPVRSSVQPHVGQGRALSMS